MSYHHKKSHFAPGLRAYVWIMKEYSVVQTHRQSMNEQVDLLLCKCVKLLPVWSVKGRIITPLFRLSHLSDFQICIQASLRLLHDVERWSGKWKIRAACTESAVFSEFLREGFTYSGGNAFLCAFAVNLLYCKRGGAGAAGAIGERSNSTIMIGLFVMGLLKRCTVLQPGGGGGRLLLSVRVRLIGYWALESMVISSSVGDSGAALCLDLRLWRNHFSCFWSNTPLKHWIAAEAPVVASQCSSNPASPGPASTQRTGLPVIPAFFVCGRSSSTASEIFILLILFISNRFFSLVVFLFQARC